MSELSELFDDLIRFETELWNAVDARLRADCDLPLSRFEVMAVISRHTLCRVQEIARALAITVGGASKLVDRIEATGHCHRRVNPDDRRSSIIALTPEGMDVLRLARAAFEDELATRFGRVLSAHALRQFHMTLTTLRSSTPHLVVATTERNR